jgi:uncharacterized protein YjcR
LQSPIPPGSKCLARTQNGMPRQSPGMANGRCRIHGGPSPGAPKGNENALKHGKYSAASTSERRRVSVVQSEAPPGSFARRVHSQHELRLIILRRLLLMPPSEFIKSDIGEADPKPTRLGVE